MLSGGIVTAAMPLSHRGRPVTRVRRALPSFAGWPVDMVFLWREVSLLSFVPPCGFGSCEIMFNALN